MYIIEYTSEGSNVDCYRDVLRSSSTKPLSLILILLLLLLLVSYGVLVPHI